MMDASDCLVDRNLSINVKYWEFHDKAIMAYFFFSSHVIYFASGFFLTYGC